MNEWFGNHLYITYLLIFIFMSYVYNKVFRTRKLPVLKTAVIYVLLAIGSVMLLVFQIVGLPIVLCLSVAIALMFLVRIRYFIEKRSGNRPT
ncbi:YlaH-like family protein [Paenibacillus alginolyticus]|uniref:YlaH-like family protein n=1 Tax=Paenibacillus alginolyticus TaxID=59839 RepID=A0ABT4GC97_9BACL|nr:MULTISPECIES: YlaH-like family protein [Paenibacillus]MCY9670836.1 YlaH-like family protein [Paenibacillus alginolyticus]MCY9693810.1 YlaH-like family protein [Paenibacillus alginolyticus]MEC0142389.1 YlaH-like family protein [Paenibacillus alginolyticus]NRF91801.1 YlaH-like family protein [Paenibacillus frigoriresistens]